MAAEILYDTQMHGGALPVPPLGEPNWSWMLFNIDHVQAMATLNTAKYNMNSAAQPINTLGHTVCQHTLRVA